MFVKVIFHGALKKICPDVYEVDASTPAEAIRGVTNQFRDKLIRKDGHRFVCSVKECSNEMQLNSCINTEEINIFPAFCASGGSGANMVQMIVGAVLVVVGVLLTVFTGGSLAIAGSVMWKIGLSMMLTAGVNMLFGIDTAKDSDNPDSSRTFGNNGNTTKIGTRIPIGYGLYKVAGQYLSVNTQAIDRKSGVSSGFTN